MSAHIIVIDNFDSFTFNLVHDLEMLGVTVEVYRNNAPLEFLLDRARVLNAGFVLSPGPGTPREAGVCLSLVRAAVGRFGVLGICLGHQVIVEAFGGRVDRAPEIVHGRASSIRTTAHPLFEQLPRTLRAARYHSLAASALPKLLEPVAFTRDGTVMAVVHRHARVAGLQFHPESILTTHGLDLLSNALGWLDTRDDEEMNHAAHA